MGHCGFLEKKWGLKEVDRPESLYTIFNKEWEIMEMWHDKGKGFGLPKVANCGKINTVEETNETSGLSQSGLSVQVHLGDGGFMAALISQYFLPLVR